VPVLSTSGRKGGGRKRGVRNLLSKGTTSRIRRKVEKDELGPLSRKEEEWTKARKEDQVLLCESSHVGGNVLVGVLRIETIKKISIHCAREMSSTMQKRGWEKKKRGRTPPKKGQRDSGADSHLWGNIAGHEGGRDKSDIPQREIEGKKHHIRPATVPFEKKWTSDSRRGRAAIAGKSVSSLSI